MKSLRRRAGTALALSTALTLLLAGTARAATIQVDSSADTPAPGSCTLREAINSADGDADSGNCTHTGSYGSDTITFDNSLFGDTITLTAGELLIDPGIHLGTLTIQGPGAAGLEVSGGDLSRVFHIAFAAAQTANAVTIHGLTISNGSITNGNGGGIFNEGSLTLDRDLVFDNHATASFNGGGTNAVTTVGGGIESTPALLTVSHSQISGNTVSSTAGGGSTSNTATALGAGIHASGGGGGILTIDQSSISDNTATATATGTGAQAIAEGGGVWSSAGAQTGIFRSTVANNTLIAGGTGASTQETGGGVETNITALGAFNASLFDDTVTGNDAANTGANLADAAGGSGLQIRNTIVADPSGGSNNCSTGITSLGHNLAEDASCSPDGTTDLDDTDPELLVLGNYGGSGQTRPPDAGSPAIDAGFSDFEADQRDLTRPWEFINVADGDGGNGADIGSVEIQGPFVSVTVPASPSSNLSPHVIGTVEDGSTVDLHATSNCSDAPLGTGSTFAFGITGIAPTNPLPTGSTTVFRAQSHYGTALSACSPSSVSYTVPAAQPPPPGAVPTTPTPPTQPKKKCKKKHKKRAASAKKKKCKKKKKRK
jgi:CSLREA domain-containing protein